MNKCSHLLMTGSSSTDISFAILLWFPISVLSRAQYLRYQLVLYTMLITVYIRNCCYPMHPAFSVTYSTCSNTVTSGVHARIYSISSHALCMYAQKAYFNRRVEMPIHLIRIISLQILHAVDFVITTLIPGPRPTVNI